MSGMEPMIIGAVAGAVTNRDDPFKGAMMGAALGGLGGAGDPIKGNVGDAYTSITASNIDDIIGTIYSVIPAELLGKPDLFIGMGVDTFRKYRQWLVGANLYHYPANEVAEMEIIDPVTGIKIYGLHGMNGTNKIVAGLWSNFFLGTATRH